MPVPENYVTPDQFYQKTTTYSLWPDFNKKSQEFLNLCAASDWDEALEFYRNNEAEIDISVYDENGNNIFIHAADHAVSAEEKDNLDALFTLVDEAIKKQVDIKISCDRYTGPLHFIAYFQENDLSLKLLDKLLAAAKPEDLNVYDFYGKTPLLEAIESGNKQVAERLINHPSTDANALKMVPILRCDEKFLPGTSPYEAALQCLPSQASSIAARADYNSDIQYIDVTTDILREPYYAIAVQGNVDTMKVLLRQFGKQILLNEDEVGWSVLHMACSTANLPMLGFFMSKVQLDQALGNDYLTDAEYVRFVNPSRMYDKLFLFHFKKNAPYFIANPYFAINRQDAHGRTILHSLVEEEEFELVEEVAERGDADFTIQDNLGRNVLRLAVESEEEGAAEMMEQLVSLHKYSGIDLAHDDFFHDNSAILKRLSDYKEENWFGESVEIEGLNVQKLYNVLYTGQSFIAKAIYTKTILHLYIALDQKIAPELEESYKLAIEQYFTYMENVVDMQFIVIDREKRDDRLWSFLNQEQINFPYEDDEEEKIEFNFKGINFSVTCISKNDKKVEEDIEIDFEGLESIVGEKLVKNSLEKKPLRQLIFTIVERNDLEKLESFLKLNPNINILDDTNLASVYSMASEEAKLMLMQYEQLKENDTSFTNKYISGTNSQRSVRSNE